MIGLIIAAGKQSRFKSETPKALVKIGGEVLSKLNLDVLNSVCEKSYIVVSTSNHKYFSEYFNEEVLLDIGESGKGSGDAILSALSKIEPCDKVLICWGDTFLNRQMIENLVREHAGNVTIPVSYEEKPYVQLKGGKVFFSKYNEHVEKGYHDMSTFLCDYKLVYDGCKKFYDDFFIDGNYKHKHGNEFEFLDIFNDEGVRYYLIPFNEVPVYSFNTVEEFEHVEGMLGGER